MRITNYNGFLLSRFTFFFSLLTFAFCLTSYSQVDNSTRGEVTLDYIFQDTALINPRPSLKQINSNSKKIYYYADDDFNGKLDLFEYNYETNETYKFPDSVSVSEFIVLPNGDAVSLIEGDIFISKKFTETRSYTKDIRLTESDKYEYSPKVYDNLLIFRRGEDYFVMQIDSVPHPEIRLTTDESDSISYQVLDVSKRNPNEKSIHRRILFARYDNSTRLELLFPNFNDKFVKVDRQKRGQSKVKLIEYELSTKVKDSLSFKTNEIVIADSIRYSTIYSDYSDDGTELILDAETQDRHNRKLFNYDVAKKTLKEIYSESDTAWFERHGNATMFINSDEIIFESEISGYNNLYKIKSYGTGFQQIAGGEFTILESVVDTKNGKVFFSANIKTPVSYSLYEVNTDGSGLSQVTNDEGDIEDLKISSDGEYLFYEHSKIASPNELFKLNTNSYDQKQITSTISPKFSIINWVRPELITFNNKEDGQQIYAFVYKPKDFNPKKKYPLICFAHGSGYLQNVTLGFSPYRDNFMVNTFLVSQGFVILDIDFRGSLGYGKDFRNKTYRNLGYWEVSDYKSGIDYLDGLGFIDKNKTGIYGGSYGGFITLMATMRHPEYFKGGVALRAVANWQLYYLGNRWYTMARLGDLDKDESAKEYYERSSPFTYAQDLQVPLLLTHGMLDDNVFFQDMVQLTEKLIENKKDFEVMIYPKEYHSFRLQTSWLDQYKRIWKFFEKWLK